MKKYVYIGDVLVDDFSVEFGKLERTIDFQYAENPSLYMKDL